jgi:hypothetical protein
MNGIDKSNELLWHSRFDDSYKIGVGAEKTLKKAEKAGYQKGIC